MCTLRQRLQAAVATVLVAAIAPTLAACGSDSPAATSKVAKMPVIVVKSPAITGEQLPARYTCDGENVLPPLEWGAVPRDVKELALFVVGFEPAPATKTYNLSVDWAVAGLNPALHKLAAGRLPPGAFVALAGNHQQRYSVCPKKGIQERYQFDLYGLPSSQTIARKFYGLTALTTLVGVPGATPASAQGGFAVDYKRR
jgi:phosphatidylethanolamine-binding protein (PEBP) family uncharacterized protein